MTEIHYKKDASSKRIDEGRWQQCWGWDRNRNKMEFFYNVSGQLSTVMDTMGRLIQFEYEPFEIEIINEETLVKVKSGRLVEIRDFSDRRIIFDYYDNGDLKSVDFEGRIKEYVYNPETNDRNKAHNLELVRDPKGQTDLSLSYLDDKVTSQWVGGVGAGPPILFSISDTSAYVTDARGHKKTFKLIDGRIESIRESPLFTPTKFTYSQQDGLLETVTYPEGNSMTYKYDEGGKRRSAGNLTTIIQNPGGRGDNGSPIDDTFFVYETNNNQVTSITYPNGLKVENRDPDDNGNFQTVKASAPDYPEIDPLEYKYKFNDLGQLKEETNLFGMKTTYNYYPETVPGNNDQTISARQLKTTGGYLKEIISPINTHHFDSYDDRGNLEEYRNSMDIKGNYTSNKYDELETEKVISTGSLSPMSYNATYQHYKDGNLDWQETTFSTGSGEVSRKTDYKYTPHNMVDFVNETITTPTDTKTITTDYGYDLNDNLTSLSTGVDSMSFGYNDRDLVESVTLGAGANATSVSYTYDGNGNILTVTDHYGHQTVYTYDGYDRLMQVTDPLSNVTLLTLFDKGNKLVIKNFDAQNLLRESIRINDLSLAINRTRLKSC